MTPSPGVRRDQRGSFKQRIWEAGRVRLRDARQLVRWFRRLRPSVSSASPRSPILGGMADMELEGGETPNQPALKANWCREAPLNREPGTRGSVFSLQL